MSNRSCFRAQALLEFALALPILLLVVYGLLEAGRLIFTYAAVATASREAVRYASAAGKVGSTTYPEMLAYQDCAGIRDRARNTGFLLNLQDDQIEIYWDHPDPDPLKNVDPTEYCQSYKTEDFITLHMGDRVLVNVTTHYTLLLPLVPFTSRDISSGPTARTFMGEIDLVPTPTP